MQRCHHYYHVQHRFTSLPISIVTKYVTLNLCIITTARMDPKMQCSICPDLQKMRLHPPWLRLASRLPALPCLPETRWFPAYTSRLGMTVASQVPNFRIPSSTHLNPSSLVYPLTHSTGIMCITLPHANELSPSLSRINLRKSNLL